MGHLRLALPLLLLLLLASALLAGDPESSEDPREVELAEIRAEIARFEKRIEQMRAQASTLGDRLLVELELQEAKLAEATAAVELASARGNAAEAKIEELEATLAGIRSDLRRRLVGIYRLGRGGYLRLLLSAETDSGLLPALRQLRYLIRRGQTA